MSIGGSLGEVCGEVTKHWEDIKVLVPEDVADDEEGINGAAVGSQAVNLDEDKFELAPENFTAISERFQNLLVTLPSLSASPLPLFLPLLSPFPPPPC